MPVTRSHLASALALAFGIVACSEDPSVLVLDITPGHETDAFSRDPAITRVDVTATSPEGDIALGASSAPGGSFDLGEVPEDRLLQFDVTGYDVGGVIAVRGRSLGVVVGGLTSDVLPIFAQRLGEWSRPPGGVTHTHVGGVAGVLGERFLVLTGGQTLSEETTEPAAAPAYYDLLGLTASSGDAFARPAASLMMGVDGVTTILVDSDGATWIDYDSGAAYDVALPEGLTSFGEVAGGEVLTAPDDTVYLVGATRESLPATDAVLRWPPGGQLSVARLAHVRQAAAAAWLDDIGLAVAGGSDAAPGLEVLAPTASVAATIAFPPDATRGAAGMARASGQLMLLGGYDGTALAETRVLDTRCVTDCEPQTLPITLPARLGSCHGFALDPDHVVLVGADQDDVVQVQGAATAMTRTFAVDLIAESVAELGLREPRAGAVALPTPHGLLALFGGVHPDGTGATTVEMLFPGGL